MDTKLIKNKENYLFNSLAEYNKFYKNKVKNIWRDGKEGEWVFTDDKCILQILKKIKLKHPSYKSKRIMIRTVCGSYIVEQKTHKIIGKKGVAENIYSFSGDYKAIYKKSKERKLKTREFLFASFVSSGEDIIDSYKKAYPKAKNEIYIKRKSTKLLKKKRIRDIIKKEVINPYVGKKIKNIEEKDIEEKDIEVERYVYFIKSKNSVKIGISNNPKQRLKSLQTANPNKLHIIGYVNGDICKEKKIQADLRKYSISGEWFKYCNKVKEYIYKTIKTERTTKNG